jgi:hypothetical protein
MQRTLSPAERKKTERHVGLGEGVRQTKTRRWLAGTTDSESWVRMAPRVFPTAAPRGAPAAKVANAIDLVLEGGNAWASIPS